METPSQVFEEWAFQREVLDQFAAHYETGAPIPTELFDALTQARNLGRALHIERQIALSKLDFAYHTRGYPLDTEAVFREVMLGAQHFDFLPDTHFAATFTHLMGYDAGYYSYQWSLAMARDVLTRFERYGFRNPALAQSWRQTVLEQGAGTDEGELLETFLGRRPSLDAYARYVSGRP